MSEYSQFFLNSKSTVVGLDTVEISHPSFSQVFRIVRNAAHGLDATLEDGVTLAHFDYYPLLLTPSKASDDLDQSLKIQLGDLGELIPQELDRVATSSTFYIKPTLLYRIYRSDVLSKPMEGPFRFEIDNLAFDNTGCTFEAIAPRANVSSTGEIYLMNRFPMLRGFQ